MSGHGKLYQFKPENSSKNLPCLGAEVELDSLVNHGRSELKSDENGDVW